MTSKRWFRIIIWIMIAAMLISTLFVFIEPLVYGF